MTDPRFHTGDVFLFEHDDSCISRLICRLSNSPISHAAMYFEDDKIIEEGLPHIGTRPITELGDRAVHVRRYKRCKESAKSLHGAAARRLAAKDPYSMGNLMSVGVLLVFNAWKPEARPAVKRVLTALCILLAKAIDAKKGAGKHGATCSQLVYELYDEAGFRLTILQKDKAVAAGESSLVSLALDRAESGGVPPFDMAAPAELDTAGKGFDLEKMCCVVLALFGEKAVDKAAPFADAGLEDDVYEEIVRFASLVRLADGAEPQADMGIFDWGKKALEHLVENYSGFVSPGQLYSDCPDLAEEVAVIKP